MGKLSQLVIRVKNPQVVESMIINLKSMSMVSDIITYRDGKNLLDTD